MLPDLSHATPSVQDQLREAVGKTKSAPFLEAGTGTVLDFAAAVDAGDEFGAGEAANMAKYAAADQNKIADGCFDSVARILVTLARMPRE